MTFRRNPAAGGSECPIPPRSRHRLRALCYGAMLALLGGTAAAGTGTDLKALKRLSLEALTNMEVSIASKTPQRLADVAASVFVLTEEDIRRSGANSIPEALRAVPGIYVGRIDANKWSISARGMPGRFANKLLVLMDGRSVYSPIFSGVFWDLQDTLLDDIDRIEVIRGPGAAVWGANAVNGVINIITKNAAETQGGLVKAWAGNEQYGGAVRYGGSLGNDTHYRTFVKYRDHDAGELSDGGSGDDDWDSWRLGFRLDHALGGNGEATVIANAFDNKAGQELEIADLTAISTTVTEDSEKSGFDLLGRWSETRDNGDNWSLQGYFDYFQQQEIPIDDENWTVDLDFQYELARNGAHEVTWGLGYRFTHDHVDNDDSQTRFDPETRKDHLFSAFIQDQIHLMDDRLLLTLGSKVEHNDYSGFEFQPSVRALWKLEAGGSVWGSISRAVRVPARAEHDGTWDRFVVPASPPGMPLPVLVRVQTDDSFDSEKLIAYEVGYRRQYSEEFGLDASLFYNDYDDVRGELLLTPIPMLGAVPPHIVQPVTISNDVKGDVYGMEISVDWRPSDSIRIQPAYTLHKLSFNDDTLEDGTPRHQLSLRSSIDIREDVELDLWVRYVDEIPASDIDSYTELDTRLAWEINPRVTLELVGRNLLSGSHAESIPEEITTTSTEVEREFYLQTRIRF